MSECLLMPACLSESFFVSLSTCPSILIKAVETVSRHRRPVLFCPRSSWWWSCPYHGSEAGPGPGLILVHSVLLWNNRNKDDTRSWECVCRQASPPCTSLVSPPPTHKKQLQVSSHHRFGRFRQTESTLDQADRQGADQQAPRRQILMGRRSWRRRHGSHIQGPGTQAVQTHRDGTVS